MSAGVCRLESASSRDAAIALGIAAIHAVSVREKEAWKQSGLRKKDEHSSMVRRFIGTVYDTIAVETWYNLAQERSKVRSAIQIFLVDLILGQKSVSESDRDEPSAEKILAAITLDWVKRQIGAYQEGKTQEAAELKVLEAIVKQCIILAPSNPDGHYVAAILSLMNGRRDEAAAQIDHGWQLDSILRLPDRIMFYVIFKGEVEEAEKAFGLSKTALYAVAVLYGSLILRLWPEEIGDMQKNVMETLDYKRLQEGMPAKSVAQDYLYEILRMTMALEKQPSLDSDT